MIEQQLKGIDHLLYFSSTSAASGVTTITATFQPGTNPDIAQVQVQNKLTQASPLLPTEVQQQGLIVAKAQTSASDDRFARMDAALKELTDLVRAAEQRAHLVVS